MGLLTWHQVQELLHEVVAKLEVILKEPGDGAETHLSRALNYLERCHLFSTIQLVSGATGEKPIAASKTVSKRRCRHYPLQGELPDVLL